MLACITKTDSTNRYEKWGILLIFIWMLSVTKGWNGLALLYTHNNNWK